MGWKTRKERLQGDQPGDHTEIAADQVTPATSSSNGSVSPVTPQPAYVFGADTSTPPAATSDDSSEPDAITLARLHDPDFGAGADREPFVLDLDNDIFRTDSRRTSLGQSGSGWPSQPQRPAAERAARPPIILGDDPPAFAPPTPVAPAAFNPSPQPSTPAYEEDSDSGAQSFAPAPPAWSPPPAASEPAWSATPTAPEPAWSNPTDPFGGLDPNKKVPSISELMAPRDHEAPPPADIPAYQPPPPVEPAPLPPLPESYHRVPAPETNVRELPPNLNPFDVSRQREDVAAGLVVEQSSLGIPKVSPFIVDVGQSPDMTEPTGEPTLLIRFKNLSATYTIRKDVVAIGRPDSDSQNYPDVEIEMDEGVSRKHAEIRHKGNDYYVVDMGSTNGSLLNGERLIPNAESRLTHGDRIRVGEVTEIIFE